MAASTSLGYVSQVPHHADYRPWFALYGRRLRTPGRRSEASVTADDHTAPIQGLLPETLLLIFARLPPPSLALAACVCRGWKALTGCQSLWRAACMEAFTSTPPQRNEQMMRKHYGGSWKRMLVERAHLRFDGVYVARNTYLRRGVVEFRERSGVHLVAYYRYFRFFPDGTALYRTSPLTVAKVAPGMVKARDPTTGARPRKDDPYQPGRWQLTSGGALKAAMLYPSRPSTVMRVTARLRGTCLGAWNRIDLETITTYDSFLGMSTPVVQPEDSEDEGDDDVDVRSHTKGFGGFVFVPWEQVHGHVLNLSPKQMDLWIPG